MKTKQEIDKEVERLERYLTRITLNPDFQLDKTMLFKAGEIRLKLDLLEWVLRD